MRQLYLFISLCLFLNQVPAQDKLLKTEAHVFALGKSEFLLDGKPFQIISGEMHYARIPKEYWSQRIQMAKAMGCNTIATYVFWNYHETTPGKFDFKTWNKDLVGFIKLVQEEGMYFILRPGPYVCGEWDLGGIPPYLLKIPDIKLRCMDPRYMKAVEQYIDQIAKLVKPLQITNGGPMILLQVENEYGSYGNDKVYMQQLKQRWKDKGINIPFYTSDGATPHMLEAGSLPGCAVGLDPGGNQEHFDTAEKSNPNVPTFSGESYPGWLTHWGEAWAKPDTAAFYKQIRYLLQNNKSFNFYVLHGGTNFGLTAGANSGGKGYEPDITSYDYDAPIDEQGNPTHKFHSLRKIISSHFPNKALIPIPRSIKTIQLPIIEMKVFASVWSNLPKAILAVQPTTFEANDQNQGFMLYRTTLIGRKSGKLHIQELHDYATIFLDGKYIGTLDRRLGINSIDIPTSDMQYPVLDIFVEGMGHINFGPEIIDRKGITDKVTLNNMTLMNWEMFPFPMGYNFIKKLKPSQFNSDKQGIFFKGKFVLSESADTFIDLTNYKKGLVWINGHLLGRYWEIGPQQQLYCPAAWLKKGSNEVIIFDLHQTVAKQIN